MTEPPRIRVKVVGHAGAALWLHQLPHGEPFWGDCEFIFDRAARDYDWLVAYEDVSPLPGQKRHTAKEVLACPRAHTLFVTAEPSSVKHYGRQFTGQFGVILTSQEAWALPHPERIFSFPPIHWFYGLSGESPVPFDDIASGDRLTKHADLSMVYSPKRMRHTMHRKRNAFMQQLIRGLPEMAVYGRGARKLIDKSEALDSYRYHVAVENHIGPHHWTEKLADAFLGLTLPFYVGCPNASDYFPRESFIPLDLDDPERAVAVIREAIRNDEFSRRLPAIREARCRVLYDYNLFAVLAREIAARHQPAAHADEETLIYSRYALRRQRFAVRVSDAVGKLRSRLEHRRRGLTSR